MRTLSVVPSSAQPNTWLVAVWDGGQIVRKYYVGWASPSFFRLMRLTNNRKYRLFVGEAGFSIGRKGHYA